MYLGTHFVVPPFLEAGFGLCPWTQSVVFCVGPAQAAAVGRTGVSGPASGPAASCVTIIHGVLFNLRFFFLKSALTFVSRHRGEAPSPLRPLRNALRNGRVPVQFREPAP